jgi:hypothetical protein
MLVDVVRLRYEGRRIPREQLDELIPVRGLLWMSKFRPAVDSTTTPFAAALLCPQGLREDGLLPVLDWACVRGIKDGELLVSGVEDLGRGPKSVRTFRQSWWCRLVLTPEQPPLPPKAWRQSFEGSRRSNFEQAEGVL